MDANALNEIADLARVLQTFAPKSGRKLRKALDDLADFGDDDRLRQDAHHEANVYREQCTQARQELNKLAVLIYANLPEVTPEYCRINPMWSMEDADTPWPEIVAELRRIEDAAIRKLLATPDPEKPAATDPAKLTSGDDANSTAADPKPDATTAPPSDTEDDGYVVAVTIWKGRFETYRKFANWLSAHPEIPNEQRGQRRYVHAVKCLEALAKQDQVAFDRLDNAERTEVIPDTVDDATYLGNVESLYRRVFDTKKP